MIDPDEIRKKGVEHLQKHETVIVELLQYNTFTKADICRCGNPCALYLRSEARR